MYHQYHQVKYIPLEPPSVFSGTTSYSTRTPVYFANIPMFRLCFTQFCFVIKPFNGGMHYHHLKLTVLILHFMSIWMSLSSTETHSFDNINMVVTICMFFFVMITKGLPNPCKNTLAVKQVNKSNWQPKQLISEVAKNKIMLMQQTTIINELVPLNIQLCSIHSPLLHPKLILCNSNWLVTCPPFSIVSVAKRLPNYQVMRVTKN